MSPARGGTQTIPPSPQVKAQHNTKNKPEKEVTKMDNDLFEIHEIHADNPEDALKMLAKIIESKERERGSEDESKENNKSFPYSDMIYAPEFRFIIGVCVTVAHAADENNPGKIREGSTKLLDAIKASGLTTAESVIALSFLLETITTRLMNSVREE